MTNLNEKFKTIKMKKARACLHDQCSECNGTGKKENGQTCIHYISCPCPKCTPTY